MESRELSPKTPKVHSRPRLNPLQHKHRRIDREHIGNAGPPIDTQPPQGFRLNRKLVSSTAVGLREDHTTILQCHSIRMRQLTTREGHSFRHN